MYKHLHYKNTKYKYIIVVLMAVMVLSLAACGKTPAPNKSELSVSTDTQVEPSNEGDAPTNENPTAEADTSANDEAWKKEFEKSLLDGKEMAVYLEVSDTEIYFWDSASGGKLLAVAKYPETLAGATEALKNCDYTDIDEDGNSDLTAGFIFTDGSTTSLVWFYADGGLIYNEEFSRLPGDATVAETT